MKVRLTLILASIILLGASCTTSEPYSTKSYGYFGELIVFTDKVTYDYPLMNTKQEGAISTVERIFEESQPYYLSDEPYYIVIKRKFGGPAQAAKTAVSVLVLVNAENKKEIEPYIKPLNFNIDSLAETEDSYIHVRKDVWAEPQTVIFLFAKNEEDLQSKLVNAGKVIRDKFLETEKIDLGERVLNYDTTENVVARNTQRMFNMTIPIPTIKMDKYRLGKEAQNFAWFKYHGQMGMRSKGKEYLQNIAIMARPYSSKSLFDNDTIDSFFNAKVKQYIPGPNDTIYMELDDRVEAITEELTLNGVYTKRTKAWWHYANAFGGGPITLYTFYHEQTGYLITCAGFFLGPQVDKTRQMRELEMSMENIKLN